jgi:hypothetical protein
MSRSTTKPMIYITLTALKIFFIETETKKLMMMLQTIIPSIDALIDLPVLIAST